MAGWVALGAEVVDLGAQAVAEKLPPEPVHHDPRSERVLRRAEPAGEVEPGERAFRGIRHPRQEGRRGRLAHLAGLVHPVAPLEHANHQRLVGALGDHDGRLAVATFEQGGVERLDLVVGRRVPGGRAEEVRPRDVGGHEFCSEVGREVRVLYIGGRQHRGAQANGRERIVGQRDDELVPIRQPDRPVEEVDRGVRPDDIGLLGGPASLHSDDVEPVDVLLRVTVSLRVADCQGPRLARGVGHRERGPHRGAVDPAPADDLVVVRRAGQQELDADRREPPGGGRERELVGGGGAAAEHGAAVAADLDSVRKSRLDGRSRGLPARRAGFQECQDLLPPDVEALRGRGRRVDDARDLRPCSLDTTLQRRALHDDLGRPRVVVGPAGQVGVGGVAVVGVDAPLLDVGEEGAQGVEVLRREGVELVVVALAAVEGRPEPGQAHGADAVGGALGQVLLRLSAPLAGHHVQAVEAGSRELLGRRAGQEVAGQLLDGELVERLVVVERLHNIVAVGPGVLVLVAVEADGIGVAGDVEPVLGHPFTEMGRGEEPVDERLAGVG